MSDDNLRIAFEAIGSSVWQSMQRLNEGSLASSYLSLAYFEFRSRMLSSPRPLSGSEHDDTLGKIEENSVYFEMKDRRRYVLLASIGVLDSLLSDVLRFTFLRDPNDVPSNIAEKRQIDESEENYVERIVRWSRRFASQRKRIDFIRERFSVTIEEEILLELGVLTNLRNDLAHHSGLYRFKKNEGAGDVWVQPKPLPEVSEGNAMKAMVIVAEICDAVLVAMCRSLFAEEPRVRIVTPEVATVHSGLRAAWAAKRARSPAIKDFAGTRWIIRELDEPRALWVEDQAGYLMITPTGIEVLPALFKVRESKVHGMDASLSIDEGQSEDVHNSREILDQMLTGKSLLVKYYEKHADEPSYAKFSLDGFPETWEIACRARARKFPA